MNSVYIALWGAGLSTLLALVKLWEAWRNRFQVDVGGSFPFSPRVNIINIRNLTGHAIILNYWELLYSSGRWPFLKLSLFSSPDTPCDYVIKAHDGESLKFSEINYFSTNESDLQGRGIYIRLHFSGRRPILRRVL